MELKLAWPIKEWEFVRLTDFQACGCLRLANKSRSRVLNHLDFHMCVTAASKTESGAFHTCCRLWGHFLAPFLWAAGPFHMCSVLKLGTLIDLWASTNCPSVTSNVMLLFWSAPFLFNVAVSADTSEWCFHSFLWGWGGSAHMHTWAWALVWLME